MCVCSVKHSAAVLTVLLYADVCSESSSCLGAGVLVWLVLAAPVILLLSAVLTLLLGGKYRSTAIKEVKRISV